MCVLFSIIIFLANIWAFPLKSSVQMIMYFKHSTSFKHSKHSLCYRCRIIKGINLKPQMLAYCLWYFSEESLPVTKLTGFLLFLSLTAEQVSKTEKNRYWVSSLVIDQGTANFIARRWRQQWGAVCLQGVCELQHHNKCEMWLFI